MSVAISGVESFNPGQMVQTSFGVGVVSAISRLDSIIYVTLSKCPAALYLLRPEQVEAMIGTDSAGSDL